MPGREELIDVPRPPGGDSAARRASVSPRQADPAREAGPIVEARESVTCQRRDSVFRRSLAAADCAAVFLTLLTVVEIHSSSKLRLGALAALPAAVFAAKLLGLYDRDEVLLRKVTLEEMPKLFHLATLCSLVLWLGHGLVIAGPFTRGATLLVWAMLTTTMPMTRVLARAVSLRLTPPERCLVVADRVTLHVLEKRLGMGSGVNAEIVAYLDPDDATLASQDDAFVGKGLDEITRVVRGLDVHRVIVAPRSVDGGDVLDLVRALKASGTRVSLVPRMLEVLGTSLEFDDLYGITVMGVRRFRLSRSSALLKRAFDLTGASLLLIVLAPLMAVIAAAIKAESRGSVLFRQVRVGRGGARFGMLKFRTMVSNAEELRPSLLPFNEAEPGFFKLTNDPRATRIGRLLRRASLDELPQLINVLRGEMSLVGPRPLVREEDEQILGWSRRRLDLAPGITGHWQILGSSRIPLRDMVAIDCVYVTTWSLWTDIRILLRTVPHVLGLRGL
jgi:exopolysaccharide biosynthesis polyprenyl glycosylphosphotransferase